MNKAIGFRHQKKALSLAIGGVLLSVCSQAQNAESLSELDGEPGILLEEVVVFGVRASQAKAIDIKRGASNIVDSIVAEDIGKLPDLTITDSLQRITGVQITREANEGTSLNVRGMPQVLTTLNGEQFLSPWTITDVGANYSDIPAGMISGADVHKSYNAGMLAGGISGSVDLKTFRPTELDAGWIGSVKLEGSQGENSDTDFNADGTTSSRSPDTNLSMFIGYNHKDKYGFTLGAFDSSTYAANYQIFEEQRLAFLNDQGGTPGDPSDLNGDNDLDNDWYLVPAEFGARSNFMERERQGISLTMEAKINDSLSVKGDLFYTRMDQYDRGVKASFNGRSSRMAYQEEGRYFLDGELVYYDNTSSVDANAIDGYGIQEQTGLYNVLQPGSQVNEAAVIHYVDANGNPQTRSLHTLQIANITSPEFQVYSTNTSNKTASINGNIQVDYTNQENLELTFRYVRAEAEKQTREGILQQGTPAWLWIDDNLNGRKDRLDLFDVTVDYRGSIPSFHFEQDLSSEDYLQYYQGYGQGDTTDATLDVLRVDGTYVFNFSEKFDSLDFGIRHGVRDADFSKFYYVMPTARYSTWNDPKVAEGDRFRLREGNAVWQVRPELLRYDYNAEVADLKNPDIGNLQNNNFTRDQLILFNDFGPISGFGGGVQALSPATWDDPLVFLNRLYPGTRTIVDPSFDYSVTETSMSSYVQLNFNDDEGVFGIPYQGNVGVRLVDTKREVERSIVPEELSVLNSIGSADALQRIAFVSEKELVEYSYTQFLPSFNINFYPKNDLIARFGYSRTTSRNDLNNIGSSQSLTYQTCNKTYVDEDGNTQIEYTTSADGIVVSEEVSCVSGGADLGQPDIKPWLADVYNTSLEWYFGENAILAAGLFLISVDTSVELTEIQTNFADADGVNRGNTANISEAKNVGASDLYGIEFGYRQPFKSLPSFLSATGLEFNYTYSESSSNGKDIEGHSLPLPSNSKHQTNIILWYDDSSLNVRLAYNWRSKEYVGNVELKTNDVPVSLGNWLEPTGYLDLSVNYWFNDHVGIFFNGTNLTETHRISYSQFEGQFNSMWAQERRYSAGVTVKL